MSPNSPYQTHNSNQDPCFFGHLRILLFMKIAFTKPPLKVVVKFALIQVNHKIPPFWTFIRRRFQCSASHFQVSKGTSFEIDADVIGSSHENEKKVMNKFHHQFMDGIKQQLIIILMIQDVKSYGFITRNTRKLFKDMMQDVVNLPRNKVCIS